MRPRGRAPSRSCYPAMIKCPRSPPGERRATAVCQRTMEESSISAPPQTPSHFSGLALRLRSRLGSLCQVELWVCSGADAVCSQNTSEAWFSLSIPVSINEPPILLILVIRYERFSCKHLKMFIKQSKTRKRMDPFIPGLISVLDSCL